jgi:hypothetical protein
VDAEARGTGPKDYHLKNNLRENLKPTLNIIMLTRKRVVLRLKKRIFLLEQNEFSSSEQTLDLAIA